MTGLWNPTGSLGAADDAAAPGSWPLLQTPCGGAQSLECTVCHCQIAQFDESPGDHFEGQFEGQNGGNRHC